ncbi:hypothetical protein L3X38_031552 [Prunus dulcis]|uniref:Uncharacterized protein n=1 Tax=Prunus dulcis TaxID=3755 RepID=A0AAD4YV12_PRUDU|nr:hypothetical protein L3X38_031552 [Prunus dulcis]
MHAKKLKSQIAGLEASLVGPPQRYQGYNNIGNSGKIRMANTSLLVSKKIIQMDMFQVEERGFYVKLVCNKVQGVAASLY